MFASFRANQNQLAGCCILNPAYSTKLDAIRELLTTGGRTLAQAALSWLWAPDSSNIPVPGARTVEQIEGLAGAFAIGTLPDDVIAQIETLILREPDETPDRSR